ncbi:hypothetical protein KSP40_PGU016088 [Platanthera guangdongensis]|uniref:Uncharacterized protein n=1 Tax=Platanthera guangdongensis TaxID=2320717 RepID=A0ABR2M9E9_9ASPA
MDGVRCTRAQSSWDLGGLGPKCGLGTEAWAAARSVAALALQNYGGFEVVYDHVGPELRNELLGQLVPEMFSKPARSGHPWSRNL